MSPWCVWLTPPCAAADNMAIDHALLRRSGRTGGAVLRLYSWERATLSFGRHEATRDAYDRAAIEGAGLSVVRRPTGGRTVLHDREVTYSVTARLSGPVTGRGEAGVGERRARARDLYAAVNRLLVDGLRRLGVRDADTADDGSDPRLPPPAAGACFDRAAGGEVVARGRKLVGSAQWRENGAVLQHGSILIADDQFRLAAFRLPGARPPMPTASLSELLERAPAIDDVARALRGALDAALCLAGAPATVPFELDAVTARDASALRAVYEDDGWTWRR